MKGAVNDSAGEFFIVEDSAPVMEGFIGGKEDGLSIEIALVHHLKEHIRRPWPIAEIAHLINNQHMGLKVRFEGNAPVRSDAQVIDQRRSGGESSGKAILDGFIGNGNAQMGFAGTGRPFQNKGTGITDQFRP